MFKPDRKKGANDIDPHRMRIEVPSTLRFEQDLASRVPDTCIHRNYARRMTWPAVVFWIAILLATVSPGPWLLYVFAAAGAFGTLQMVPGEIAGGTNLLPQSVCTVFLVCKILLSGNRLRRAIDIALDPRKLGLLTLFLAYALLTAYALPRLFTHAVEVFPMTAVASYPMRLEPSTANITQSAYLVLSVGTAIAFASAARNHAFRRHFVLATLLGGWVLVITGIADLLAMRLGLAALLEPFRNATYALLTEVEVQGVKRVVGLMSEASAFGASCVAAAATLAFLRPCFPDLSRIWIVPPTVLALIAMAALSTSSTAYVGLGVFVALFAFNWVRRWLARDALNNGGLVWEAFFVFAAAFAILGAIVIAPDLLDPVYTMIDQTVFRKTESGSYIERSLWTTTGMEALYATWGLGVGLGSARTSSWLAAVTSNTGVIGAVLIACFFVRLFGQRVEGSRYEVELSIGLKLGLLVSFALGALSATTPDFGVVAGAELGLISGLARSGDRRTSLGFLEDATARGRPG
jgi:hypothetical protein